MELIMDDAVNDDWSLAPPHPDDLHSRWERMLSDTHLPWRVDEITDSGTFQASVRRRYLADLVIVECECGPNTGHRGRYEIENTDDEYLVVLMTLSGSEVVCQGDRESQLHRGSMVAWDSTQPAKFRVNETLVKRSLFVPKSALGEYGARGELSHGIVLDSQSPSVQLLNGYLHSLSRTIDGLPLASIPATRNATIELLAATLNPESILGFGTDSTRVLAEQYIDRNLRDVNLTPHSVAQAIGVSVRSLHRSFGNDETVSSLIRTRRLARARDELGRGDSIATIATRWRFSDASHFSRLFKAMYDITPSEFSAMSYR